MDRRSLIVFRSYLPALIALLIGFVALVAFWGWENGGNLSLAWRAVRWLPILAFLVGIALAIVTTLRLWRTRDSSDA